MGYGQDIWASLSNGIFHTVQGNTQLCSQADFAWRPSGYWSAGGEWPLLLTTSGSLLYLYLQTHFLNWFCLYPWGFSFCLTSTLLPGTAGELWEQDTAWGLKLSAGANPQKSFLGTPHRAQVNDTLYEDSVSRLRICFWLFQCNQCYMG